MKQLEKECIVAYRRPYRVWIETTIIHVPVYGNTPDVVATASRLKVPVKNIIAISPVVLLDRKKDPDVSEGGHKL